MATGQGWGWGHSVAALSLAPGRILGLVRCQPGGDGAVPGEAVPAALGKALKLPGILWGFAVKQSAAWPRGAGWCPPCPLGLPRCEGAPRDRPGQERAQQPSWP